MGSLRSRRLEVVGTRKNGRAGYIMGDVLEDFRGKDCAFVANWLQEKGLNKFCAVFEGV